MKFLLIALALLSLSACSFRGWDPPNYNQSLNMPNSPYYVMEMANLPVLEMSLDRFA